MNPSNGLAGDPFPAALNLAPMNKYLQLAYHIIEQAEELAERKYRQAVTKTLPRQLAKTPKDEHRDEIRRRIHKLKDWQQTGWAKLRTEDGQIFEYSPYLVFKVEERSREELAASLATDIRAAADGLTNPLSNEPGAIMALSEQMYISRYIRYLVGLLDGPAQAKGFEWIGQTITEAAQRFPDVQPWQIADETKTLTEIAEAYFDDLASGAVTAQDIAADIQKYIDEAKRHFLAFPVNSNVFKDGTPRRNAKFTLECQALVLPKLKALFEPTQPPAAQAKPAAPAEELTFEGLFLKQEHAARTIAAMQQLGIVNEAEVYAMGPKRKAALVAVWDVLKRKNLVHLIPDAQAAELLARRFHTTIAPRTAGNRPVYYAELFRELTAIL